MKNEALKTPFYFLLGLMIFCTVGCKAQATELKSFQDIDFIDSLTSSFKIPNPGISYMVIKKGEIVLEKSMGYADVENKVSASPETNYRIASISKPFTAIAIQKLIYQNKLSYQTTLSEIFPDFPEYGNHITVENLLNHRSGIIEYNQFIQEGKQLSDEAVLEGLMSVNTINSQPNEKFAYRNSGYALLAQIVEKITSKEFEDFMQDEIFSPIGMSNTSLYMKGEEIPNRAYGYTIEEGSTKKTDQNSTSAVKGDGCIYSSMADFYRWDQALYSDIIVPQSFLNEGFNAFDENGKTDSKGYGYGWQISYAGDVKIVEHTGSSIGFTNHYIRVPSLELSVVVFTNRYQTFYKRPAFTNIGYGLMRHFSDGKVDLVE